MFKLLILISITANSYLIVPGHEFKPRYSTVLDAVKGQEVMAQCSRSTPDKASVFWNLEQSHVDELERNLWKVAKMKAEGCCFKGFKISDLKNYGYQYIGIEIKKEKYIYINAFWIESADRLERSKNWKTEPVIACDGGESFWGVVFNVETSTFSELAINGVA